VSGMKHVAVDFHLLPAGMRHSMPQENGHYCTFLAHRVDTALQWETQ
jgi:hypothetical protein